MQRRALEEKREIGEGWNESGELEGKGGEGSEEEINSFVDVFLCCYLKSNAFFSSNPFFRPPRFPFKQAF